MLTGKDFVGGPTRDVAADVAVLAGIQAIVCLAGAAAILLVLLFRRPK